MKSAQKIRRKICHGVNQQKVELFVVELLKDSLFMLGKLANLDFSNLRSQSQKESKNNKARRFAYLGPKLSMGRKG
jgi:hypothetical protein